MLLAAELVLLLTAGLTLLLIGMKWIELALYKLSGGMLKQVLLRLTRSPLRGLLAGTGATAVLQSSSAVTVATIGFVNSRLITFPQTLGIVLGTNIGSCLTTELIGLRLGGTAQPLLAVAAAVWLASLVPRTREARRKTRASALALSGFALVLLGIEAMQSATPLMQQLGLLDWFIAKARLSLLWGILAGACLTAAIHSSAAAIGIAMGMAAIGALPVDLGIAIVLGCNIGTCVTAMLAAIGGNRYGHYVALTHLLLNVGGTALFIPLIGALELAAAAMTPDPAAQLAHAQTIFNIVCSLLALPLCYLPAFRKVGAAQ